MKSEKGEFLIGIITVFVIAIILGIFILLGLSIKEVIDYGTKDGQVIDKKYHAAYTSHTYSGKIMIPQYHPENYQIKIQKEIAGENKSIWISVDSITYHELNIGDYYPTKLEE